MKKLFKTKTINNDTHNNNLIDKTENFSVSDLDNWIIKDEKKIPFETKGIYYHSKARECQDESRSKELYLKCIENWGKVVEITDDSFDYDHLVNICWEADFIEEAKEYITRWLSRYPNDANLHSHLATLYELEGKKEEEKLELQTAISLKPDNHYNYQRLAELYCEQGDIKKGVEIYKSVIQHFADDVDSGIHCGAYDFYIEMCLKNNDINEILELAKRIFLKIDDFITGKSESKIYGSQDKDWYIYKKRQFGKKLGGTLIQVVKSFLKEEKYQESKSLIDHINKFLLLHIEDKSIYLELHLLEADIFRRLKQFDKSWRKYNEALSFCQRYEEISEVYSEMGEQLINENRFKEAISFFLYALVLTPKSSLPKKGLKNVLKLKNLHKQYETFVNIIKDCKDFTEIQQKTDVVLNTCLPNNIKDI